MRWLRRRVQAFSALPLDTQVEITVLLVVLFLCALLAWLWVLL